MVLKASWTHTPHASQRATIGTYESHRGELRLSAYLDAWNNNVSSSIRSDDSLLHAFISPEQGKDDNKYPASHPKSKHLLTILTDGRTQHLLWSKTSSYCSSLVLSQQRLLPGEQMQCEVHKNSFSEHETTIVTIALARTGQDSTAQHTIQGFLSYPNLKLKRAFSFFLPRLHAISNISTILKTILKTITTTFVFTRVRTAFIHVSLHTSPSPCEASSGPPRVGHQPFYRDTNPLLSLNSIKISPRGSREGGSGNGTGDENGISK